MSATDELFEEAKTRAGANPEPVSPAPVSPGGSMLSPRAGGWFRGNVQSKTKVNVQFEAQIEPQKFDETYVTTHASFRACITSVCWHISVDFRNSLLQSLE